MQSHKFGKPSCFKIIKILGSPQMCFLALQLPKREDDRKAIAADLQLFEKGVLHFGNSLLMKKAN